MTAATITVPLDTDTARFFSRASAEDQRKMRLMLSLWLREFALSPTPLKVVMDEISEKAQVRGLTPDILESLLHGN